LIEGYGIGADFFADSPLKMFQYKEAKASESRSYRDENEREYYIPQSFTEFVIILHK